MMSAYFCYGPRQANLLGSFEHSIHIEASAVLEINCLRKLKKNTPLIAANKLQLH